MISGSTILSQVGFPALMSYLMYRMANGSIRDNTEAMKGLRSEFQKLRADLRDQARLERSDRLVRERREAEVNADD